MIASGPARHQQIMTSMLLSLALLADLAASTPTIAATGLVYEAPPDCPALADFVQAVSARGGAFDDASERVLVVSIQHRQGAFGGALSVRDARGSSAPRLVHGASCVEVSDALALVAAIELRSPDGQDAADPPSAPSASASANAPDRLPAASVPDPDRLRGHTRIFPSGTETVHVGAGDLRFDMDRRVSVTAGGTWGLIPSTFLPRYSLAFTTANFVTTPEGAQRLSGLVFQANVDLLGGATYQSPNTKTDIDGVAFGVSMCQSPFYDTRGASLLICLGYGGGVLNLSTTGPDGGAIASKYVGFGAVNAAADLQLVLAKHVFVSVRGGGSIELGDITAQRADGGQIFKSSAWSGFALGGLGLRY